MTTSASGLVGSPTEFFGLKGLIGTGTGDNLGVATQLVGTIPAPVFVGFQAVFAVITVALISGAIADRAKFGAWMTFAGIWATIVYFPVAHWVFAFDGVTAGPDSTGGWIANQLKAIDFAGGTAVHINAGAAGLALALVLGKRIGWPKEQMRPHNLTLVMIGAGLLWFGWFGFNAGSAVAANGTAGVAWINTFVATGAAMLGWLLVEKIRDGHSTSLGAASGVVAGLVGITPSCSSVNPVGAIILGFVTAVPVRPRGRPEVPLRVRRQPGRRRRAPGRRPRGHPARGLPGHGRRSGRGRTACFYGGGFDQLWRQAVGAGAVLVYSFVLAYIIGTIIQKTMGFRLDEESEASGIDYVVHAETAYDLTPVGASGFRPSAGSASASSRSDTEVTA